jgi:hypothetical protein
MMEAARAEGRVLAFVRGLKFSARLVYMIRDCLSGTGLQADWGHILDADDSVTCSPECDIIIHRKWRHRWNGHGGKDPVMDFKFVDQKDAIAVISCKSYLKSIGQDYDDYSRKVRGYVKDVWLYAECCPPAAVDGLRKRSRKAGYNKFWYLYLWDGERPIQLNEVMCQDFLKSVKSLVRTSSTKGA